MIDVQSHLADLLALVRRADEAIMDVYNAHATIVKTKADDSPITQADEASHDILVAGLKVLFPDIPVVSEEGDQAVNAKAVKQPIFWLVDPIDGTREFIQRSGDFTICLGLIEDDRPVFGIISAPAHNVVYYGGQAMGSYKQNHGEAPQPMHVPKQAVGVVLASRMNPEPTTTAYIQEHYANAAIKQVGSQLKLPYIAEGLADACPRFNTTMHPWDLAAGQAILEGAGGKVTRPDGSAIDYHDGSLLVGDFIASA
jgi:3'(2'), 5'-bisphosphate nucleotidase